jgi:hypothetical protein
VLDYAPGEGMNQEGHEEVYRVAFDSANAELKEISAAFEELRIRKDRVEKLVSALGPLVEEAPKAEAGAAAAEEPAPQPVHSTTGESVDRVVTDPFQRRIDHVLGIGAGIRDVRKYVRQF